MRPLSGLISASWPPRNGPFGGWKLCFPDAGWIADTAEEPSVCAAALDEPTIFAFRTGRIAGTAATSNFSRSIRSVWQSGSAGLACRHQISAMLDMLTSIPDPTVSSRHAQQPPTAFPAFMAFGLRAGQRCYAIGSVLPQFGDKGRRPRVRGKDCQGVTRPGHRDIHHAPLLGVLESFFLGRHQRQQGVVDDL